MVGGRAMAKADLEYRLGETLDSIPFGRFHVCVIAILSLVGYTEAYDTAVTGSLIVLARQPLGLTAQDLADRRTYRRLVRLDAVRLGHL
jgi:hypothetical protein